MSEDAAAAGWQQAQGNSATTGSSAVLCLDYGTGPLVPAKVFVLAKKVSTHCLSDDAVTKSIRWPFRGAPMGSPNATQSGAPIGSHSSPVTSVSWYNDGSHGTELASDSCVMTVQIWSVGSAGTFESQSTLKGNKQIDCVAFSPDGKILAAGDGSDFQASNVWLYDPVTCVEKSTLSGHSDCVRDVSWSPDGTMLASGSFDKTIKLSDAQSEEVNSTLSGHRYTLFFSTRQTK